MLIITGAVMAVIAAFNPAHGYSFPDFIETPKPFISQPPFVPLNDFSSGTYHLTVVGLYGYERYRLPVSKTFTLHRGGFSLAASGAFTGELGWNVAAGVSCPAAAITYASITIGSCMVPVSASLAWRFAAKPGRFNCVLVAGLSYSYCAIRGYYRRDMPGPPWMFHLIKGTALADVKGSVFGLFAGIRPMVCLTKSVSLRPFALYRITFDASGFYYHVRIKFLDDEPEESRAIAFKFRQLRDAEKPIHEIIAGLELTLYGVGVHGAAQFSPAFARTMVQVGLSYTHPFVMQ